MLIMNYVKTIESIMEGKKKGVLDTKRMTALLDLLGSIKKKVDVQNVSDMAMCCFASNRLAGRLNGDVEQEEKYSDYMSALGDAVKIRMSKLLRKLYCNC